MQMSALDIKQPIVFMTKVKMETDVLHIEI